MRFSFVIPIFKKKPEQLRRCLKSLYEQSYKDINIIGVFDGRDETLEMELRDFQKLSGDDNLSEKRRIRCFSVNHGGAPFARNAGFKYLTSDVFVENYGNTDFVCFWDADCYAEPDMVDRWAKVLTKNPELDFVYNGYYWTDVNQRGYESEPFDSWLITRYNYLCSMWPLKREMVVEWDESLSGLQDWDYWRRIIAAGAKGKHIGGYSFCTDYPDKNSISAAFDKTRERVIAIKEKHEDMGRDILVQGHIHKFDAIRLAKLLDADYYVNPFYHVKDYKLILCLGFDFDEMNFHRQALMTMSKNAVKIIYWTGLDAEKLYYGPYSEVIRIAKNIKEMVNFNYCPDLKTKNLLEEIGIYAEILIYPREPGPILDSLPDDFKVLVFADELYHKVLDSIIKAMPDIKFTRVEPDTNYPLMDYSVVLQYDRSGRFNHGSLEVLIQGRYLISNVQEPYSGYIECGEDVTKFKNDVIARIREIEQSNTPNKIAQNYYIDLCDPLKFKAEILKLKQRTFEVV